MVVGVKDRKEIEVHKDFKVLLAYSPYHNLRPGTAYPATLVTTADHDDRVVPDARLAEGTSGARGVDAAGGLVGVGD